MSKALNADDELRLHVHGLVAMVSAGYAVASQATDDIMKLILADRKKHELQAALKELKWAKTASVWNIEVRISELEQELEKL